VRAAAAARCRCLHRSNACRCSYNLPEVSQSTSGSGLTLQLQTDKGNVVTRRATRCSRRLHTPPSTRIPAVFCRVFASNFVFFWGFSHELPSASVGGNATSSAATFKGFRGFHFTPIDARNVLAVRDMIKIDGASDAENEEKFKVRLSPAFSRRFRSQPR
jgi:hypothetical protein